MWFDEEIDRVYDEVVQKSRFLIKLSVPQIFKEAKMRKDQEESAKSDLEEEKKASSRSSSNRLSARMSR